MTKDKNLTEEELAALMASKDLEFTKVPSNVGKMVEFMHRMGLVEDQAGVLEGFVLPRGARAAGKLIAGDGMLRLGCGAGFSSDRLEPAIDLASKGRLDYLVFETIGERTLAFGHRDRKLDPKKGYNPQLAARLRGVLGACKANGTRIVTNMGVANVAGGGRAGRRGGARARPEGSEGRGHRGRRCRPPDGARHDAVRQSRPQDLRGRAAGRGRQRISRHRCHPAGAGGRGGCGDHRPRRRPVAVPDAARASLRLGARRLEPAWGKARWSGI